MKKRVKYQIVLVLNKQYAKCYIRNRRLQNEIENIESRLASLFMIEKHDNDKEINNNIISLSKQLNKLLQQDNRNNKKLELLANKLKVSNLD